VYRVCCPAFFLCLGSRVRSVWAAVLRNMPLSSSLTAVVILHLGRNSFWRDRGSLAGWAWAISLHCSDAWLPWETCLSALVMRLCVSEDSGSKPPRPWRRGDSSWLLWSLAAAAQSFAVAPLPPLQRDRLDQRVGWSGIMVSGVSGGDRSLAIRNF